MNCNGSTDSTAFFPSIGWALSNIQTWSGNTSLQNYDTAWVGKWHLSSFDDTVNCDLNGPYGFSNLNCLPNADPSKVPNGYGAEYGITQSASPDGLPNEGTSGGVPMACPGVGPAASALNCATPPQYYASDSDIFAWFETNWLPSKPTSSPWFCAVSFINPHDISNFPGAFMLPETSAPYCFDQTGCSFISWDYQGSRFPPPDPDTSTPNYDDFEDLFDSDSVYSNQGWVDYLYQVLNGSTGPRSPLLTAQDWNGLEDPIESYYPLNGSNPGKPDFHRSYASNTTDISGSVIPRSGAAWGMSTPWQIGWETFLNYYAWMQAWVDVQIKNVVTSLQTAHGLQNTMIILMSDHGEYGGSHSLHGKGGASYEESINAPLYIHYPGQTTQIVRPQMVSSVDFLPFLLTVATKSEVNWRKGNYFSYLGGRESIYDFVTSTSPQLRRTVPLLDACGVSVRLPYILHTFDEPSQVSYSHMVAMRAIGSDSCGNFMGGKIARYDQWACNHDPVNGLTTWPTQSQQPGYVGQFEFYNYAPTAPHPNGNTSELLNDMSISSNGIPTSGDISTHYLGPYGADPGDKGAAKLSGLMWAVANELFSTALIIPVAQPGGPDLNKAHQAAKSAYLNYDNVTETCSV